MNALQIADELSKLRMTDPDALAAEAADKFNRLMEAASAELRRCASSRYPHWHCDTHGDFDARVAVGCPECMREAREKLRASDVCDRLARLQGDVLRTFGVDISRLTADLIEFYRSGGDAP